MSRCLLYITFSLILATSAVLFGQQSPLAELIYTEIHDNGIEAGINKYEDLRKTAGDKYDFNEGVLNLLGYRFLGEDQPEAAIAVLRLNCETFPKSPNTYDSLGEALMKAGQHEEAIIQYENVLRLLPAAGLPEQQHDFLQKNAEAKLVFLNNPDSMAESEVIARFLGDGDNPFGSLNPAAAPETAQFGQLAGLWQCTNYAFVNGQWFSGWEATWVWKYILDGSAVQDTWYQPQENLPPTSAAHGRDFVGTNVRIYDPFSKQWEITWMHNGVEPNVYSNSSQHLQANAVGDEIIMTPANQGGANLRRIIFHNMSRESFDWKSERSTDGGTTWTTIAKIKAKRIR